MAKWGAGTFGPWSPGDDQQDGQDQQGQGQQGQQGQGQPGQGQGQGQGQPGQGQGQPGQGKPGQGQGQPSNDVWSQGQKPGQPGQGQGQQGKPGQGQGQGQGQGNGQGKGQGQGQGAGGNTPNAGAGDNQAGGMADIDDIYADLEQKFSGKKDTSGRIPQQPQKIGGGGGGNTTAGGPNKGRERIDKPAVPTYSWKELMSQFIMTQKKPESTYARVSKRSITGVTTAVATGAGVVKPGERQDEEAFKLLFVFDTSGSMGGVVSKALSEASSLVNQNFENVHAALGVTFFADSPEHYAANLQDKVYWAVRSFNDLDKSVPAASQRNISELFSMQLSGGTNFSTGLASELSIMASKGYNIIMFTDSDILIGSNWKVFLNFYKSHKRNMFLILNDRNTFAAVCKTLGSVPNTFGSLDI